MTLSKKLQKLGHFGLSREAELLEQHRNELIHRNEELVREVVYLESAIAEREKRIEELEGLMFKAKNIMNSAEAIVSVCQSKS